MRTFCGGGFLGRALFVSSALSWFVACGGGGSGNRTPTQPASPATPVVPSNQWMLKGWVAETLTGTPIEGAKLVFTLVSSTREVVTQADGSWEISQASSESLIYVEVTAGGYVTRRTYLKWNVGTRGDIVIDLIKESAPFSLTYYRELIRDYFERPETPQRLRRWAKAPNFYIDKFNPSTGEEITATELDLLIATLRGAVPEMTGGMFEAGTFEVGTGDRGEQAGVIAITFVHEPEEAYCGRARVASDPGRIWLNYSRQPCQTSCGAFAPRTVAHEVGHAMGFWHVAEGNIMNTSWFARDCGRVNLSATERHHARIAYARPPGNLDPDWDPAAGALFQPPAGPPVVISCK